MKMNWGAKMVNSNFIFQCKHLDLTEQKVCTETFKMQEDFCFMAKQFVNLSFIL